MTSYVLCKTGSLAVFKVTARDQGHYKGPSGAFVTYCNISWFFLYTDFYVFIEKQEKLSLNYLQYPHLSGALISSVTGLLHNRIMTPNIQEHLSLIKHSSS